MDEESIDVFIDKLGNFDVIAKVLEYAKVPPDQLTGLNIWMMNQLGNMTLVTNVIRNTGQLVVFGTAESLSYLAHGKGIFIMIVMLYQF